MKLLFRPGNLARAKRSACANAMALGLKALWSAARPCRFASVATSNSARPFVIGHSFVIRHSSFVIHWSLVITWSLVIGHWSFPLSAQEYRAFWADAFHNGFKTPAQVTQLVADLRAANCNAVVVEVRKRGDAYYRSNFEPLATDVVPQTFDPLQDLLDKAHDTNTGARIEVHAWLVTYPIWGNRTTPPTQPTHPYNLHPDWLTEDPTGNKWVTNNYQLDPGHPAVQQHNFNVAMDILTNYPTVDGINYDYIRYPEHGATANNNPWGYNPVSVERFNRLRNRTGLPAPTDSAWLDWRREQVTAFLRKFYLSAIAVRPNIKVSADTITWAPGVTSDAEFYSSSGAYVRVLQDWRAWVEEGILDLNIPMTYFRQHEANRAIDYLNWNNFAKDRKFNRHVVIGPGLYLNYASNGITQVRITRDPSPTSNYAQGVCGYSYAVPASDASQAAFFAALTTPSSYDPILPPIFATPATVPVMPWKVSPALGHVKGFVTESVSNAPFDGLAVSLTGPVSKTLVTDGTGFFGAVDLVPGDYSLTVSTNGYAIMSSNITITAGIVRSCDFQLVRVSLPTVTAGARAAIVSLNTPIPARCQIEYWIGANPHLLTPVHDELVQQHSILLSGLAPDTTYCCVAIVHGGGTETRSGAVCFRTAGTNILDNVDAAFTGSWTASTSAADKYLSDYCWASTVTGAVTRTATYTPAIITPGLYDVYIWYPQGGNRSAAAPHTLFYNGGSTNVLVNQQINGGAWRLLAAAKPLAAGTSSYLQIANNSGESGKVVVADGVRFVYSGGQEPPAGFSVPQWWAQYYFPSNINTLEDYDGDGYPVWAEFWLGVCPTNPASRLNFRLEESPAWRAIFSPCYSDRLYRLQSASEPAGPWQTLTNLISQPFTNNEAAILISPTNPTNTYYRLKVDWAP